MTIKLDINGAGMMNGKGYVNVKADLELARMNAAFTSAKAVAKTAEKYRKIRNLVLCIFFNFF
jgi:hypothetical protein